ncbi:MAG TPA: N-acetylmuramoyl-L-alanine amidase [Anaerolineae bacterium]|nr:N-acetylmuramoyl-L-alanine amidase [Anaerolineae bacterium]
MMTKATTSPDPWAVGWMIRALILISFLAAFAVPMNFPIIAAVTQPAGATVVAEGPQIIPLIAVERATATPSPSPFTPTPSIPRVGLIAGHAGHDSGAICPDGLQEADVNMEVARRVVALLTPRGWQIDLFDEFDVRLNDYRADVLLSIHADSCTVPGKTGFKVARAEAGSLPESGDRLVACLSQRYEARTGLPFDPYTITYDMTRYHAFYEIDRTTPAAIIEVGFLLDDRQILTQQPDLVAQGIADGLICFVENESP